MDKDIEERIFAAATSLYEESGREVIPTVHLVRKTAKTNMNDVVDAMKKWRDLQRAQPVVPVLVHVPQAIEEISRTMLSALWQSAQELSNNALRLAQAGWEAERLEATAIRKEMADGYEAKVLEVEAAQAEIAQLQANAMASASELAKLKSELVDKRNALTTALASVDVLQARLAQADAEGGVLKNQLVDNQALSQKQALELAQALAQLDAQEKQARQVSTEHAGELDRLNIILKDERRIHVEAISLQRDELVEQAKGAAASREELLLKMATVKAEAEAARREQSQHEDATQRRVEEADERLAEAGEARNAAREDAAQLRGQVETLQAQTAKLLAMIERWQAPRDAEKTPNAQAGEAQAAAGGAVDFDLSSPVPETQG